MSWTDDRVNLLKKLWVEGKTAAEIAKELGGGVSRNAVIGKAHRLKLSNRVSPIQQNNRKPVAKPVIQIAKPDNDTAAPERAAHEKVSLLDLKARMCSWPLGDPKEKDFGFCGHRSMMGLPYCREHSKMAYQAATRNRIIKEEAAEVTVEVTVGVQMQGKSKKAV